MKSEYYAVSLDLLFLMSDSVWNTCNHLISFIFISLGAFVFVLDAIVVSFFDINGVQYYEVYWSVAWDIVEAAVHPVIIQQELSLNAGWHRFIHVTLEKHLLVDFYPVYLCKGPWFSVISLSLVECVVQDPVFFGICRQRSRVKLWQMRSQTEVVEQRRNNNQIQELLAFKHEAFEVVLWGVEVILEAIDVGGY